MNKPKKPDSSKYTKPVIKDKLPEPTPEAKALSLFLMAFKDTDPIYKEKSKRINKLWRLVSRGELSNTDYLKEVKNVVAQYGGYKEIVEKTVHFYIKKTGKWTLKGEDKYCRDAQRVAEKHFKK